MGLLGDDLPLIVHRTRGDDNSMLLAIFSSPVKRLILPEVLWLTVTPLMSHDNMAEFMQSSEEGGESRWGWYPNHLPIQCRPAPLCALVVKLYPYLMLRRFFLKNGSILTRGLHPKNHSPSPPKRVLGWKKVLDTGRTRSRGDFLTTVQSREKQMQISITSFVLKEGDCR